MRRRLLPAIKTVVDYSQDWDDQAKCKELALNQIAGGSGVVFQVAGGCGLGALNAAGERKRWGIGVDADQSSLGKHILTSAKKGVDSAVFLTIKSIQDGVWQGGRNATFGLKERGVGLGKVSSEVPQSDLDAVADIGKQIASGEITGIPTEVAKKLAAGDCGDDSDRPGSSAAERSPRSPSTSTSMSGRTPPASSRSRFATGSSPQRIADLCRLAFDRNWNSGKGLHRLVADLRQRADLRRRPGAARSDNRADEGRRSGGRRGDRDGPSSCPKSV